MPRLPTPGEYQEALQSPEDAFLDEDLRRVTPDATLLGLPRPYSGARAVVFPMRRLDERIALKCFLGEIKGRETRYRRISDFVNGRVSPSLVWIDYRKLGIRVADRVLPVLVMEWVDGVPIRRFVAVHFDRPEILAAVAESFRATIAELASAGAAHGDLQHENLLVTEHEGGLRLRLIDYDAMFVPALKGRTSPEVGHRNFQHPDRTERDFGPWIDRFPSLVIYTALSALIHRPDLWARYDTDENLLFRFDDFYDPDSSTLFSELHAIQQIRPLVDTLRTSCFLEPEDVPPLETAIAQDNAGPSRIHAGIAASRRRASRSHRGPFERYFLPATVSVALASVLMLVSGMTLRGSALLAILIAAAVGSALMSYHRLPVVRRRRRLRREIASVNNILKRLGGEQETITSRRHAFLHERAAMRERRLEELQEAALHHRLKYHFVGELEQVDGVSHKVVVRLKRAGIRAAHHVEDERLARVREVGNTALDRVRAWRRELVSRYRDAVPRSLSPAEERRLEREIQKRLESFDVELARLVEKQRVQRLEREELVQRLDDLPLISFDRYLSYLAYLSTLPAAGGRGVRREIRLADSSGRTPV